MSTLLSSNTQAILLLTAPLLVGNGQTSEGLLTQGEYKRLARFLRERQQEPGDLLGNDVRELTDQSPVEVGRLESLLSRGFLLSQAIERWQARSIWVVGHLDDEYPRRLRNRLQENAPAILYGCGEAAILDSGGLAVVGSRNIDDVLVAYTEDIGQLAASALRTIVSGGARGIDQSAMRGALENDGKVIGVLADSLERSALNREHRNFLMNGRLVLISPYDPLAGFNVGNAMQRNKLIYALSDWALVVSSDYEKGGTWAGAVEQLEKLRLVPVYVRSNGTDSSGLNALRRKGALPWPNPTTPEALGDMLEIDANSIKVGPGQTDLFSSATEEIGQATEISHTPQLTKEPCDSCPPPPSDSPIAPADELFAKVRELVSGVKKPRTEAEVADDLRVSKSQAKEWLQRLVEEGVMERYSKPVKYAPKSQGSLL